MIHRTILSQNKTVERLLFMPPAVKNQERCGVSDTVRHREHHQWLAQGLNRHHTTAGESFQGTSFWKWSTLKCVFGGETLVCEVFFWLESLEPVFEVTFWHFLKVPVRQKQQHNLDYLSCLTTTSLTDVSAWELHGRCGTCVIRWLCVCLQEYQDHHSEDEDGDLYEKPLEMAREDRVGGVVDKRRCKSSWHHRLSAQLPPGRSQKPGPINVLTFLPASKPTVTHTPSSAGDTDPKKVRTKLMKFLMKRPTLQSVKEKGYIRGTFNQLWPNDVDLRQKLVDKHVFPGLLPPQPLVLIILYLCPVDNVFGCHLATLCSQERTTVPHFVEKCIKAVERRGNPRLKHKHVCDITADLQVLMCLFAGLDIDGLYRVSGNLATIQKLRYKADHGTI